jgi:class 3 adenylate cyclase
MDTSRFTTPQRVNLLISFIDIMSFSAISQRMGDPLALFEFLDSFAKTVIRIVDGTSGLIVKFIGDACLLVFPEDAVDEGIRTIIGIKSECEEQFRKQSIQTGLRITAHFGEVAIGPLGCGKCRSLDIIGDAANTASVLGRGEHRGRIIISPQAFRKLSAETRKLFHKYTPPIVYLAE